VSEIDGEKSTSLHLGVDFNLSFRMVLVDFFITGAWSTAATFKSRAGTVNLTQDNKHQLLSLHLVLDLYFKKENNLHFGSDVLGL
jgi:hypothetical protein